MLATRPLHLLPRVEDDAMVATGEFRMMIASIGDEPLDSARLRAEELHPHLAEPRRLREAPRLLAPQHRIHNRDDARRRDLDEIRHALLSCDARVDLQDAGAVHVPSPSFDSASSTPLIRIWIARKSALALSFASGPRSSSD